MYCNNLLGTIMVSDPYLDISCSTLRTQILINVSSVKLLVASSSCCKNIGFVDSTYSTTFKKQELPKLRRPAILILFFLYNNKMGFVDHI